jgi:hypothetical protein
MANMSEPGQQADTRTDGQPNAADGPAAMSAESVTNEKAVTVTQAADILRTTPRNVRRWIAQNKLKAIPNPDGPGRLILMSAVRDFQDTRNQEPLDQADNRRTNARTDTRTSGDVRPPSDPTAAQLLEQMRSEIEHLRARTAEQNAIIMQQARALADTQAKLSAAESELRQLPPAGNMDQEPHPEPLTPSAAHSPTGPVNAAEMPLKREPRPLWKVILGIR